MRFSSRPLSALLLLLPLILAAEARAGTVYVPYPGPVEIGDVEYEAQIWASNTDESDVRRIEHFFIPSREDGTVREDEGVTLVRIPPGTTMRLRIDEEAGGLIEVLAAPQVVITARLVQKSARAAGPLRGVQLPVISSDNLVEAGTAAHLQGWERNESATQTNVGLLNLGQDPTQCEVRVFRADSSQIASTALISLDALSHVQFDGALEILEADNVKDVRGEVTCDQPFYPYASIYHDDPAEIVVIGPSESGDSELVRPGDEPKFTYLDELNWSETSNVRSGPHKNVSGWDAHAGPNGIGGYKPIEINGTEYEHGISWFPGWNDSWVAWRLDGEYSRFTATVRIDDEMHGKYEWARVDRNTGRFIELKRPPGGFRAQETHDNFRVSAGARIRIRGDDELLFESEEFYAYGPAVEVDVDVTGVEVLRIELEPDHSEQAGAPHRAGLRSTPALVKLCSWFDLIDVADAKLFAAD
ncbi:MAG: NPCBM/NEW2 domain-containing protein [Thermoanaerobaculia bacterium]